jgi:hypothetical protein
MASRRKLWVWSGVTAAVLALAVWGGYKAATANWGPISTVISIVRGNPEFPGCTTQVKAEGALTGATYRITESKCTRQDIHIVFYSKSLLPFSIPIYIGNKGDPVPEQVRQHDAGSLEIMFAKRNGKGSERLVIKLDANGIPVVDYKKNKADIKASDSGRIDRNTDQNRSRSS